MPRSEFLFLLLPQKTLEPCKLENARTVQIRKRSNRVNVM